ncbi:SUMO-activating enzyme subunit 1 [Contarinia nasturtii]|uniref:SUMO-activating enzyme subunit 1 n=1 Tax=Contarinia nasturtii TaxID=265458 RepID=UPI0012D42C6D|nr:SUMO-activating enzyme subunit 1 [Contarinia nasturtii]
MVENNGIELTEDEAELYDRQIRLWGLDSQKRIRAARILICGLNGLGAEVAKNIILSGVKSVALLDDKLVSQSDFCSQFLVSHDSIGQNRAEASLFRAQALNPMVEIVVDKENVCEKPDEYFHRFDVVILIEVPSSILVRVDNICRLQGIKFFCGDVWGMNGYSFTDLQEHEFAEEITKYKVLSEENQKQKRETVKSNIKRTLAFPPLQDVFDFDFNAPFFTRKLKRTGPAYVTTKILQRFRDTEKRDPNPATRNDDLQKLFAIRDEIAKGLVPDSAFVHVFAQVSPVAAIVGGELSQEVIKAVSQKEPPHLNVFLFDPVKCCGFVEPIAV